MIKPVSHDKLTLPQPVTRPFADKIFEVMEDWVLEEGIPGHRLIVKKGFLFDGASIPRIFWLTTGYPMAPGFQAAGLGHDAAYAAELLTRKMADDVFHWCLRQDGVNAYTAYKMWLGVRIGGWRPWGRHTPESIADARELCILEPLTVPA